MILFSLLRRHMCLIAAPFSCLHTHVECTVKKSMHCILSNLLIYSLSFDDYALLTILQTPQTLFSHVRDHVYVATSTFNPNWRDVDWATLSFVSIILNIV